MSRIQFSAEDIHPVVSEGGGVYSRKDRRLDKLSRVNSTTTEKGFDVDVEVSSFDERDARKKQEFKGWSVFWLAFQSIGVVYGDIGTSPLYVYSSTFSSNPSYEDLVGALSLIIYALTIMVSIKYVLIVLNADDEGEGGTFALYSLISRYARLVSRHPREEAMTRIERHRTGEMPPANSRIRAMIEGSSFLKWTFKVVGVFGVALLLADGVLTPAQSLLGAIQGLEVVSTNISTSLIVGVSCAILVLVFLVQPFGTSRLAYTFAPIVIIWLLFNLAFGIYNLVIYDASVFKAFSPYFAGAFLVRNGRDGWLALGGVLLAFTGVETLFADLGAFNKRAIQLSWLCFAYPCLLFAYIGQAANISANPGNWANPFYLTVPPGMVIPSLIVAILASTVASQAVITGSFQLLSQVMKLSYFPQIEMIHVSKKYHHQVYVPLANWIMMIGTVVVTAIYQNTTQLGLAYGACVILVCFITTCMVSVVAIVVWRLPVYVVLPVFIIFALWDGAFLSSTLTKVPNGAWLTLAIAVVLTGIFIIWRFGKEQQWKAEALDSVPLSRTIQIQLAKQQDRPELKLQSILGGAQVMPLKGLGIFFDKAGNASAAPLVFLHFLRKFSAMPDVTVFFHLRPLGVPTVPADERFTVHRCYAAGVDDVKRPLPNCYRIIVRHGYMDEVVTPDLGRLVTDHIQRYLLNEEAAMNPQEKMATVEDHDSSTSESAVLVSSPMADLQQAVADQVVYIVGKEQLRMGPSKNIFRKFFLALFMCLRENTRARVQQLHVEADRLVEIGFIKDI